MNQFGKNPYFNCQKHSSRKAEFFSIDRNNYTTVPMCSHCALLEDNQAKSVIFLKEMLEDDGESIIANWPPLKDGHLINRFSEICDEIKEDSNSMSKGQENIIEYFKKIKEEFNEKITILQKQIVSKYNQMNFTDLISKYNQISQKNEFKELLQNSNPQSMPGLDKLIYNIGNKNSENQKQIEQIISTYNDIKTLSQTSLDSYFSQVFEGIDYFQKNGIKDSFYSINQFKLQELDDNIKNRIINDVQKKQKLFFESIESGIKLKNMDNTEIQLTAFQDSLQKLYHELDSIYSTKKSFLQQIGNGLKDKIKSKEPVNVVNNVIGSTTSNLAFIDIPVKKGFSFKIKVVNSSSWFGIGIVDRQKVLSQNYEFIYSNVSSMSSYMISSNGYSWTMQGEQPYTSNGTDFTKDDIISISIKKNKIIFDIKNKKKIEILFSPQESKTYCVGFRTTANDIFQII